MPKKKSVIEIAKGTEDRYANVTIAGTSRFKNNPSIGEAIVSAAPLVATAAGRMFEAKQAEKERKHEESLTRLEIQRLATARQEPLAIKGSVDVAYVHPDSTVVAVKGAMFCGTCMSTYPEGVKVLKHRGTHYCPRCGRKLSKGR